MKSENNLADMLTKKVKEKIIEKHAKTITKIREKRNKRRKSE